MPLLPEKNAPGSAPIGASDERGFKTWLGWALLLFVALLSWVVIDQRYDARRLSLGKTEAVATRFQSAVLTMNSEAVLAAYGNAGSLDRMTQWRNKLQTDLTLLQRGGYISSDDPVSVLALDGVPEVPLSAVSTQLETFDRSTQVLLGASEVLKRAAEAETALPTTIQKIMTTASELGQIPTLNSGAWGNAVNPLRQDLTRREMSSMPVVFAPMDGGQALAKQWSDLFASRAVEAQSLANIAAQDKNLTSRDKALLVQFAADIKTLSEQSRVLLSTNDARLAARRALDQIRSSATDLQQSVEMFLSAVRQMGKRDDVMKYSLWAAIALTWIGFFGVIRSLWVIGYGRWRMTQDSQRGAALASATDRVTRELKKILARDTGQVRLNEAPNSPVFALSSMINQTLSQRDQASTLMEEQARAMQKSLFEMDGLSSIVLAKQIEQKSASNLMQKNTNDFAERLADAGNILDALRAAVQASLEMSYKGGALAQENSWQMESLRENTQSTSKRIKRLGETAQSIGVSTDLIKDISRKIKVLALNVAVEAAAHGPNGRNFTLLARELERLAQNADQAVKDIDTQVGAIQTDAKETVASMEEGTSSVVHSGKLSVESGSVFKELDRGLEHIRSEVDGVIKKVEASAVGISQESDAAAVVTTSLEEQEDNIKTTRSRTDVFRSSIEEIRKWLTTIGRDI